MRPVPRNAAQRRLGAKGPQASAPSAIAAGRRTRGTRAAGALGPAPNTAHRANRNLGDDPGLRRLLHGTEELPAAAVRHWRVAVPVVVGTGLFIAYGDAPLSAHIQSPRLESRSAAWSNRGLFALEPALVLATAAIEERCLFCAGVGDTAAVTLTSEAYAMAAVRTLSFAAGRERPGVPLDGHGNFWEGGTSFPSGHATAAFTMASVLAHRYPRAKWGAGAADAPAAGVAGARVTAKGPVAAARPAEAPPPPPSFPSPPPTRHPRERSRPGRRRAGHRGWVLSPRSGGGRSRRRRRAGTMA